MIMKIPYLKFNMIKQHLITMSENDNISDTESIGNADIEDNETFINFKNISTKFFAKLLTTIKSSASEREASTIADELFEHYEKVLTSYDINIEELCSKTSDIDEIESIFKINKKSSGPREKKPPTQKQLDARKKKQDIATKWKKLSDASKDVWEQRSFKLYMDRIKTAGQKDAYKIKSSSGFLLYSKYDGVGVKWDNPV